MQKMKQLFEDLKANSMWDEIIFEADTRIQITPHIGRLHYFKGFALFQLNNYEEAEPSLMRAYTLDELQVEALIMHIQCLEKLERYRDAMDIVKAWQPRFPNENRLEGLRQFLSDKWTSVEHDGWEKSRLAGRKIVWAAGHEK